MPATKADPHAVAIATIVSRRARRDRSQEINERTARYRRDPEFWLADRLQEQLWSKQGEIAAAVVEHRRVAVQSCHDAGKSYLASRLACWWIDSYPPGEAFVVTTATTGKQVRAVLWREIRKAHAKGKLPGRLNQTEWFIDDELVAFGQKPADYDETAFQGIHARRVLVIIDEGCGVPEGIFRAAGSLVANDNSRILVIGNPDDPTSYFERICRPGSGWHTMRINMFDTPNFTKEKVPDYVSESLASPIYEKEIREELGKESGVYLSKVLGLFPEDASDGVVLGSWATKCRTLDREWTPDECMPIELGMDVGAGGDETNIRVRYGAVAGRKWAKRTPDWADAVGMALQAIDETGATAIKVDANGIGWGVVGRLRELQGERHNCMVIPVMTQEASSNPMAYYRLRDQIWWEVGRELSRAAAWDLSLLDDIAIGQLIAPKYIMDSARRVKIEAKLETRKRLGRSPDDADALLLAYFTPVMDRIMGVLAMGGARDSRVAAGAF